MTRHFVGDLRIGSRISYAGNVLTVVGFSVTRYGDLTEIKGHWVGESTVYTYTSSQIDLLTGSGTLLQQNPYDLDYVD